MTGDSIASDKRFPKASLRYRLVWETVSRIPRGRVATYGQIARLAGLGNHARMVGYALHATPAGLRLPWHRVINAAGKISLPREDGRYDLQKALLMAEGIAFHGEKVNLQSFGWRPEKEAVI